ncbi:preprotein translocase subunit SecE [Gordonia sp. VNK21]|uniref:preprotein translocase subunit SecE n=1 Tax=Gordonia sp. VNK21 TaxID=3382483 RepID=UPI0038D4F741
MAKRDRKASGKPEEPSADGADDTGADIDIEVVEKGDLRPSGKRKARGERAAGGAGKSGGSVAVADRPSEEAEKSRNVFVRIWNFLKQVVGELRKVIWPTRSEMINYSIAVLVFVVIITAIIAGLDIGFAKLMLTVFG